jgi:Fuc2NAc and GlcNAc transferase
MISDRSVEKWKRYFCEMKNLIQSHMIAVLVVVFIASLCGTYYYRLFALQRGILAKVNFRSLHERIVPRGGGLAFSCVFSLAILAIGILGDLPAWLTLAFGVGGIAAAIIGFIDDVVEIRATRKLFAQSCLAAWVLAIFYQPLYASHFNSLNWVWSGLLMVGLLFISVWFINLYNFIDGVDGMAIGGAVFICISAIAVLCLTDGNPFFILIFAILGAASLGFLFFNLPPASVFMGDAGSIFLGYCFGTLLLATVFSGQISVWTWITILGYFIGDTTTTSLYRFFYVKKWYGVHRSHAYQNLARIHNHAKVTYGVGLYNILWLFPLVLWSALVPDKAPFAAILALAPAVLWTVRFGPWLSPE